MGGKNAAPAGDPLAGHLAGHLVGRTALGDRAVEHFFQGEHQARQLALHPGRLEGLTGVQGADLAGHIDDAAAVDHIVRRIEQAKVEQGLANDRVGQLVVGSAGDDPGAQARQGFDTDRAAQGAGGEDVDFGGEVAYVALRARAAWQQLALDLDYAVAPDAFAFGGDIDGVSQDFEARISYQLPQGDMRFFAGYRYNEFAASGDADGLSFDSDLVIDGFQLGVLVTF